MPNGEEKPGDALADRFREQFAKDRREEDIALIRLEVRAEKRSHGDDEISEVIHQEALERRAKKESEPPLSKASYLMIVLTVVKKFPAWGSVVVATVVALALITAYVILTLRGVKLF